ncbi:hypothetical protein [Arsenophonus sp. ENCA]|nr:hypothetical protein [Arsenophonus sp. ENCA]
MCNFHGYDNARSRRHERRRVNILRSSSNALMPIKKLRVKWTFS